MKTDKNVIFTVRFPSKITRPTELKKFNNLVKDCMKKLLKALYHVIPFKRELFLLLRKVWRPQESIYKHLHFIGVISVPVDNTRSFKIKHYGYQVENEIFWAGLTGGWEKESLKLWIRLCAQSSVIFDIGANTGVYSLIAKTVNPKAQVFAFEPVKRVFQKLQYNVALNDDNIQTIEAAVSNQDGTALIYDTDAEHTYSVTVGKNMQGRGTAVIETKIKTITLHSFIQNNNLGKIDLMKVDVETHEPEVLEGFGKYLAAFRPTILIEILDDVVGAKVQELVKDLGYLYFNIDETHSIRQTDAIGKSDYFNYLLCLPPVAEQLRLTKAG
jgi:FkbM family methyltransferase